MKFVIDEITRDEDTALLTLESLETKEIQFFSAPLTQAFHEGDVVMFGTDKQLHVDEENTRARREAIQEKFKRLQS